jgi:glyoxylase-like metal-dependent hydrolase (beta-lactamase superfamily II)
MKISDYVHAIRIPFTLNLGGGKTLERFVYSYLIYGKEICLIDSGVASSEKIIFEYIRRTGREPEEITRLIQTHTHPRNVGNNYTMDAMELCKRVVAELGLPPIAATPHLARTFQANVKALVPRKTGVKGNPE